jgi:hypothetical protein
MLSTGMKADGRLSHKLIEAVKLKYVYKSDKAIRKIWKTHKQAVLNGDPVNIHRTSTPVMAFPKGSVACPGPNARLFAVCRVLWGSPRAYCTIMSAEAFSDAPPAPSSLA